MHIFSTLCDKLVAAAAVCAGALFVTMMMHISLDVVLRYFFNSHAYATIELTSFYYMVALAFIPLIVVQRTQSFITVDLIIKHLSTRIQNYLHFITLIITLFYLAAIAYATTIDAYSATQMRETVMSNYVFYIWPSRWFIPIGVILLMLEVVHQFCLLFINDQKDL